MNWTAIGGTLALVSAIVTAANAYLMLSVKLAIAELRTEIERMRQGDRQLLIDWAREEFVRADMAAERFRALEARLGLLENPKVNQ